MKQTSLLAVLAVAAALLLAGGAVLAKDVVCIGGDCLGTKRADTITGSVFDDAIVGRGGDDTIAPGTGDDEVRAGGGNDRIVDAEAFRDVDTIFGGKGNDTIDVREGAVGADDPDFVDCGAGTDTVFVDATDTRLNCEIFNPS